MKAGSAQARKVLAPALLVAMCGHAVAEMQALSEEDLGDVTGTDGIQVLVSAGNSVIDRVTLRTDTSTANAGQMGATAIHISPVGTALITSDLKLNVGATTLSAGTPGIDVDFSMSRFRVGGTYNNAPGDAGFNAVLNADPVRTFGTWALVSDMNFLLQGQPFFGAPATSRLRLAFNNAKLFYRQNWYYHANIAFDNLDFVWDMPNGTIDINSDGLVIAGDTNFNVDFDLYYKFNPDQNLSTVTGNDRPLLSFAWGGLLSGAEVHVRGGGLWDTATNAGTNTTFAALPGGRTEGVNVGLRWNYGNNFNWRIGHASGDREYLEFGDWRNLEHNAGAVSGRYGFDIPLLAIDSLNAGNDSNAGNGLCWGGTQSNGTACTAAGELLKFRAGTIEGYAADVNRSGAATLVQLIRNGNLVAWSNSIKVGSVAKPGLDASYNWGLIYTLANIQSNIYLYPGGSESDPGNGSRNQGIIADVLFMTQSEQQGTENWTNASASVPTRWSHGSHFMIADTAKQQGIGLLGASFLLASDDLRLWLKNTWNGEASPNNWEGGIDLFSPRTRAQFMGLFGGARLPNGLDLVKVANVDLNFEGLWNFRISPSPTGGGEMIAYSAAIRFRCGSTTPFGCQDNAFVGSTGAVVGSGNGSYISLSEPGRSDVDIRFANMSGDIAWTEGTLRLRASDETGTGKSDLLLSNNLLIGASATARMNDAVAGVGLGNGGAAGRTFTTTTKFGGNEVWSLAIPAATMSASLTIRPQ